MIVIALGSNQSGPWGSPAETVTAALARLDRDGLRLLKASRLLKSSPFGLTGQPDFVNAVALVETHLPPAPLLHKLHAIERSAGRRRILRWGPRTLDLDLLDYHGLVSAPAQRPMLPHPGIAGRIFVLKPLAEIAPRWKHPLLHSSAAMLLRRLDVRGEGAEI